MAHAAQTLPIVALGLGTGSAPRIVTDAALGEGLHRRVLRMALALRGGVSLAVWIGGAVAELDVARRVRLCRTPDGWDAFYIPHSAERMPALDDHELRRARVYARMLAQSGFDSVEFDVLSGASAGGLNAVVYAVAQRAAASVDSLLTTWQNAADVRNLLQPPGARPVDSIMRGDAYFWPQVLRALHELHDSSLTPQHPLHRSSRVTVDLAATVIDSAARSSAEVRDGRGYFHFLGTDERTDNEDGRRVPTTPGDGSDLARLAYAARSTSSYPGAFEPALVFSKTKEPEEGVAGDDEHVDMSFAFSGHRRDWNHPFRVIDGSILDDVPVDQAFRAIRRSASSVPSSRALLYLDPLPPAPPPRSVRPSRYGGPQPSDGPLSLLRRRRDRQSQILTAIRAGRQTLDVRESGEDEIAQVERFRLSLLRESGRSDAYAAAASTPFDAESARRAYVRYRAATDVQFLSTVVVDPSLWQLGVNSERRTIWRPWGDHDRERLDAVAIPLYAEATREGTTSPLVSAIADGPQAALEAALCALTWVRALETIPRAQQRRHGNPLAELRLSLYRVLGQATDARDSAAAAALDAGTDSGDRPRAAVLAWVESNATSETETLWAELDGVVRQLRRASPAPEADVEWEHSPFSGVPLHDAAFTAHDLAPFLAPRGIPEPISSVSFARITGDEPPAHPEQFVALVRRRQQAMTRLALHLHPLDVDDETVARLFGTAQLTADDKLAGALLGNFGGFLSTAWRTNDWWWGRMDAAAGLVRILDRRAHSDNAPTRVEDNTGVWKPPVDVVVDTVQTALLEDMAASAGPPLATANDAADGPGAIREGMELGADTLDNLMPSYRLGVASRILRVASRAVDGSTGPATRIALAALRPFAVAVPLVTTPLRAALFGAVIGLTVAIVAAVPPNSPASLHVVEALPAYTIIAIIAVTVIAGFADASRRWNHLVRRLHHVAQHVPENTVPLVAMMHRESLMQGGAYAAASLATLATAAYLTATSGVSATWWILISASLALALRSRHRCLEPSPTRHALSLYAGVGLAYALWVTAVVVMPSALSPINLDHRWLAPATTAVAGALCALLLTVGWLRARASARGIIANPATIACAAGLASGIPVWLATRWLETPFPVLTVLTTVLLAVFAWGSIVWWLPEFPGGAEDTDSSDDSRHSTPV